MEVDGSLRVQPKVRCRSKSRPEFERHLRGQRCAAVHDAVDHFDIASDMSRQLALRHRQRRKKLLSENLARSRWGSLTNHVVPSSASAPVSGSRPHRHLQLPGQSIEKQRATDRSHGGSEIRASALSVLPTGCRVATRDLAVAVRTGSRRMNRRREGYRDAVKATGVARYNSGYTRFSASIFGRSLNTMYG
ncbi:MAG: hypothetical protein QOK37_4174 [Thermoanaerobaculia bacterium]|nr:hypothetical protein [Thermoanaerobaculia bacterium]